MSEPDKEMGAAETLEMYARFIREGSVVGYALSIVFPGDDGGLYSGYASHAAPDSEEELCRSALFTAESLARRRGLS